MEKKIKSIVKSTKSIEKLAHFRCGHCQKWWSIGDAPKRKKWWCPWCGKQLDL